MRTHIHLFLACLLGLAAIPQPAAAHTDDEIIPPVAQMAQGHLKQGRYADALAAAEAWIAEAPADARAFGLATTAAIFAREKVKALAFARKSAELAPAALAPRGSLVMALQLAGKRSERELARAELYALWRKTDATPQRPPSFRRDDFDHEGKKIVATEFFELQGPRGLKYEFFVFEGTGGPIVYRMAFGSPEPADRAMRVYQLDRYHPDQSQETLGSFPSELSYDEVRALVAAVVSGKRKPVAAAPAR